MYISILQLKNQTGPIPLLLDIVCPDLQLTQAVLKQDTLSMELSSPGNLLPMEEVNYHITLMTEAMNIQDSAMHTNQRYNLLSSLLPENIGKNAEKT